MDKTNAMRLLDGAKIAYTVHEYEVDENDLSGESTARKLGIPPEQIFKTLVISGEKHGFAVCCIPSNEELDLKKAAKLFGEKKMEMLHVKDLLKTTGYIRGGVSPIGMKKQYATYIHESCLTFDKMAVSGGTCGVTLLLSPNDLIKVTKAKTCDIVKE